MTSYPILSITLPGPDGQEHTITTPKGAMIQWHSGTGAPVPSGWRIVGHEDPEANPYQMMPPNTNVMLEKL